MKKVLLSLAIVLSMGVTATAAFAETPTPTPAASPAATETAVPTSSVPPETTETATPTPETTETAGPTSSVLPETTVSPGATETATPTPSPENTADPSTNTPIMYAIKNGGGVSVALRYASGEFSVEEMISSTEEGHPVYTTMFKDDTNYLPLRYFFELTGMEEVKNPDKNNPWTHNDMMDALNERVDKNVFAYVDDNGIKVAYKRVGEEAKDVDPESSFLADDNHTYVKMRELSSIIGYEVDYDDISGYAYVIINGNDNFKEEALNAIRNSLPNNDNYTTYSDGYINDGTPDFLSKRLGKDIYCVNQMGINRQTDGQTDDLLIYVDNDFHIKYMKLSDNQEKNLIIDDVDVDNGNFMVDLLAFDGNNIYGIKTGTSGDYNGTLFRAKISVTSDGNYYATDYNAIENQKITAICIKGRYCYYIDCNAGDQLKRVNKSDFSNPETLTVNGDPLTKISHYNICGNHIIYRNYGDNKIYTGWMDPDPKDNTKLSSQIGLYDGTFDKEVNNVRGIVNNGADTFYFIATMPAETTMPAEMTMPAENRYEDSVWRATFVQGENGGADSFTYTEDPIYGPNERIRNIAVLNNNLYATVGNNKDRIPLGQ